MKRIVRAVIVALALAVSVSALPSTGSAADATKLDQRCFRGYPIVTTSHLTQLPADPAQPSAPTVFFVSGNHGLSLVCGVTTDGAVRLAAPVQGFHADDDGLTVPADEISRLVVVPPGYPNAGAYYVSAGSAYGGTVWAYSPDGKRLWRSTDLGDVVGVAPLGSAAPGGPLVLGASPSEATLAMLTPDGQAVNTAPLKAGRFTDDLNRSSLAITQAPAGTPGAGNLWFYGEHFVHGTNSGGKFIVAVSPTGALVHSQPLPKPANEWGNSGEISIAPGGTPRAGTVYGRTAFGNRCFAFSVDPTSGRMQQWEITRFARPSCSVLNPGITIPIGQAKASNAGYVYYLEESGLGAIVLTPSGRVGSLKAGVWPAGSRISNVNTTAWTTPDGGLAVVVERVPGTIGLNTLTGGRATTLR